jgi:hypothetical protein
MDPDPLENSGIRNLIRKKECESATLLSTMA